MGKECANSEKAAAQRFFKMQDEKCRHQETHCYPIGSLSEKKNTREVNPGCCSLAS
jgi:hypothetical protein